MRKFREPTSGGGEWGGGNVFEVRILEGETLRLSTSAEKAEFTAGA